MDFNNGLYVFNGVPGLEASKGERIAKSLQKLQTKLKHLEQVRNSERGTSSNSESTDTQDMTLSDVKLRLLFLQIQYMRLKLRNTRQDGVESPVVETEHRHEQPESEYSNFCKETQTGMSFHEHMLTTMSKSAASHTEETCACPVSQSTTLPVEEATTSKTSNFNAVDSHDQLPSESAPPSSKDVSMRYHLNIDKNKCTCTVSQPTTVIVKEATTSTISNFDAVGSESVPPSSKDVPMHYHFKYSDVPFILGASASDSHNLIANVQNLIAKMKTHNKHLCGSRFQASRNCTSSSIEKKCSQDTKKLLKDVSDGIIDLQIKQAKAIEMIDNQNTNHFNGNRAKGTQIFAVEGRPAPLVKQNEAKKFPNTDSTTMGAAVRLKENRLLKSTRAIKKNKHVVPTNKIQTNLPQIARQRLLRSIKKMKTHLSEEDISWI